MILVVDDSLTFRNGLGDRLRREGYDVLLADSGREAIDSLGRVPDAIVVDLEMPGLDGIETTKRIRRAPKASDVPILMLTARDDLLARMQGRAAGATEFLVKEPDFDALVARVTDFVRRTVRRPTSASGPDETGVLAKVIAASGLSRIIAEAAIIRACQRAGVDARTMNLADLGRALPDIERSLKPFLNASDRAARLEAIANIARASVRSEDTDA
jgi:DNA-binding response OmpR family regulator